MPTIDKPITRIIFESPQKFETTVKNFREVCKFPNYSVNDGVASKNGKFSMYANTCSLLGMSNGSETYLGHYAPESRGANFIERLSDIIKGFCDKNGEATAFVTGGYNYNTTRGLAQSSDSFALNVEIGNLLEKLGLDFSMISCKTDPYFTDCMAVGKDAFIFSHSPHYSKVPLQELPKNPTPEQVSGMLKQNYGVYELSENHVLDFNV